ncbi:4678_t:CDS:10 [Entrophospora sp. SA101]|nr:4678_t:CDS:10 [Entrophospora sp. SA101]CAJ0902633.1 11541_t:CDS:10 [Entrophospora sp. SA101]
MSTTTQEETSNVLEQTKEECKPRIVIEKMVLINFKSYFGRQELGPFHKSFSAIVGPNGSGKSNVIDALLFVFGYRASKMRQGKISQLIHSSEESNDFEVVPQSQLIVSRQVLRNDTSKYFINGRQSNYTEVTTLLKDRAIDLTHERFLILQGEVESIAQMKPKAPNEHEDGLLEYLEDIIGTSKYKISIERANQKVEQLNEQQSEKLHRVQIVEKQKQNLESKKKEAEDFLRDENRLTMKQSIHYQRQLLECNNAIDIYTKSMSLEINTDLILKELSKYEKQDIHLQEKKKHIIGKQNKLIKTLQTNRKTISETKASINNVETSLVSQKNEIAKMERDLVDEESNFEIIGESLKEFTMQMEQKKRELAPWTESINEKQSAIDVAQSEYNLLKEKNDSIEEALKQSENDLSSLSQTKISKNSASYKEKLKSDLADARQKEDEARTSLQSSQSRGVVLSSLIKLKDSGRIRGFHDRLGNLGVIDDKYDVAISTACPGLNNIVVDNVEVGQNCIEYLKKNNLGRGHFICLNQLPELSMNPIQTPENVPRLFDLIRPKDQKFAPAFYSVLRDTLVAENLQQANRIAYGKYRWRVVTLDGKLIDKSGTMSGGGNKVSRGSMSSRFVADITQETLTELEQNRAHIENEWKDFNEKRKDWEFQLEKRQDEIPRLELALTKSEMDLQSCIKRFADVEKRVNQLCQQNRPNLEDHQQMQELQITIDNFNRDIEQLKENYSTPIENDIKYLQDQIMEVGGGRLRAQKAIVDGIRSEIDRLTEHVTTLMVTKSKSEKDLTKLENSLTNCENEIEEINNQINQLGEEIEQNNESASSINSKAEKSKNDLENKKDELDEIKAQLDDKNEIFNQMRSVEMEIKNKLEDIEHNLAGNQQKQRHWNELLEKLSLHKIGSDDDMQEDELQFYSDDELMAINKKDLINEINKLQEKVQNANPNLDVLIEYHRYEEEYKARTKELEEITEIRDGCKREYDELRKRRLDEFMCGFTFISKKLKEMYQLMTLGGNAELECCDSLDPFSEGIIFSVMPPRKSWKNISNLSGGEKTLSSLALIFALHHYKPTPIYVMDEIDAALDFRNVSIVANYIKERTKDAQFIVVSLRNNMFELADRLVGIYKTKNMVKFSLLLDFSYFYTSTQHINIKKFLF